VIEDDPHSLFAIELSVPRLVRIFAVVVLLWSLWMFVSTAGALVILLALSGRPEFQEMTARIPLPDGALAPLTVWGRAHMVQLSGVGVALHLTTLLAAIGLLRRRRWARSFFVLLLALVAGLAAAAIGWLVFSRLVGPTGTWKEAAEAMLLAYPTVLQEHVGIVATAVLVTSLLLIALLQSPDALVDPRGEQTTTALGRPAPVGKALTLAVVALVIPLVGFVALVLAFIAWIRLQNEGRGRGWVVVAMLLAALSISRDVALARALVERWA
jgi:hypothetical protein